MLKGTSFMVVWKRLLLVAAVCVLPAGNAFGQVLLSDDFEDGVIDPALWRIDEAPYETGFGEFTATEAGGVLTIEGTATGNWWPGLSLVTVPTFTASPQAPLTFEVNRVSHTRIDNLDTGAGANSSTRTSIFISDEARDNFVLFSHNSNEGGFTFNRRIGQQGDNPTGGGTNIAEFDALDGAFAENLRMKMVANGETVQLFLNDMPGPVVAFPFSSGIVFRIAAFARRGEGDQPTDFVSGVFDNAEVSQPTEQILLADDFEDGEIDPSKWVIDETPYETGFGNFTATEADGVLTIDGTATGNWWPGLALATVPSFTASAGAPLTFEVNRVSHTRVDNLETGAGANSSTRTSIFISDASRDNFVLFSHNSNEGGFTFNRRIGQDGDNPTGGGTNIAEFDAFDGAFAENLRMKMVANGETVQLFLNDMPGPVVPFPLTEGIVFRIAAYARRGEGDQPTDSVTGVFDNAKVTQPLVQELLADDFEDDVIDPSKWLIDETPYETGFGEFAAIEAGGVLTIEGTATGNWWPGLALVTVPTFTASADSPLSFEIDRVSHTRIDNLDTGAGANSSTRTSIFISDASRDNFVLFSHNSNEGGFTFNRRIGQDGDNPTGGGTNIAEFDAFDGAFAENLRMKMVANGETVQLFLNGMPGPVVPFPLTEGIVFRIAAYARRGEGDQPTDFVSGVFDNALVTGTQETCVQLSPELTLVSPGDAPSLTLQIPADAPRPATVSLVSSFPNVAVPAGAVDGTLDVVFDVGAASATILPLTILGEGLTEISLVTDFEACVSDPVRVFVPAVLLADDFEDGVLNTDIWVDNTIPFEGDTGAGAFFFAEGPNEDFPARGSVLSITGTANQGPWPGLAIMTKDTYTATPALPVTFEVDMTISSAVGGITAGLRRAAVMITNCDRTEFVSVSETEGGNLWNAHATTFFDFNGDGMDDVPPDGLGFDIPGYNCCFFGNGPLDRVFRMSIRADGETVTVFADGIPGLRVPFPFNDVIFGFGAYAEDQNDEIEALFDNAVVLGDASTVGEGCGGPTSLVREPYRDANFALWTLGTDVWEVFNDELAEDGAAAGLEGGSGPADSWMETSFNAIDPSQGTVAVDVRVSADVPTRGDNNAVDIILTGSPPVVWARLRPGGAATLGVGGSDLDASASTGGVDIPPLDGNVPMAHVTGGSITLPDDLSYRTFRLEYDGAARRAELFQEGASVLVLDLNNLPAGAFQQNIANFSGSQISGLRIWTASTGPDDFMIFDSVTATFTTAGEPARLVQIAGGLGSAPDTFIGPLGEDVPFTEFSLEATDALTLNGTTATYTAAGPAPGVSLANDGGGAHTVTLDAPITPGHWLKLELDVTSQATGLDSVLTVWVGRLPLDVNQDGATNIRDATAFGDVFRGSRDEALINVNGDDVINVRDASAFGNNWNGLAPATQQWRNASLPPRP